MKHPYLTNEELNKVLQRREQLGRKGMILTRNKKGQLIKWKFR